METPASIRLALRENDWLTSIDFKDAYFHIPIHHASKPYLRFVWEQRTYQFKALCFGLSTAPYVFTRVYEGLGTRSPARKQAILLTPSGSSSNTIFSEDLQAAGADSQPRQIRARTDAEHGISRNADQHCGVYPLPLARLRIRPTAPVRQLVDGTGHGEGDPDFVQSAGSYTVVAEQRKPQPRSEDSPQTAGPSAVHRGLERRLGSPRSGPQSAGTLVSGRKELAHRLAGVRSAVDRPPKSSGRS